MNSCSVNAVRVHSTVHGVARSTTYAANELIRCTMELCALRGVLGGALYEQFELIERGLRAWLALRQLTAIVVEIYGSNGRLLERWDLPIVYDDTQRNTGIDEHYITHIDDLKSVISGIPQIHAAEYKFLVMRTPEAVDLPGWRLTSFADCSHLKHSTLLSKLIDTRDIKAGLSYFG